MEKSLDILRSMKRIGFDTETTSLDCHSGNIRCIQLGNFDIQILVDTYTIDIQLYKELLESEDIQFIVVNGKFDAKYLHNHRICIMNMYDLFLNEQLIYLGYPSYPSASLQGLAHRYAGVSMDKSVRTEIASRGLTPEVIVYACDDVKYLLMIADKQEEELRRQDLCTAAAIEGMTIAPLSYMEWCGVIVSREKWMEKAEDDMRDLKESVEALNKAVIEYSLEHPSPGKILYFDPYSMSKEEQKEWVTNNVQDSNKTKKVKGKTVPVKRKRLKRRPDLDKVVKDGNLEYRKIAYERMSQYPYIYEDPQYDMFHESERYVCDINWSSSGQVIPLLEELGCDVMVEDKDSPTGFKKTCDAKKIKPQRYVHKIVDLYCKYKKLEKVVSTYGPKFLENIHPRTGRVYTNYHQLGTDTTRFSSTDQNLLNLPKNERTRSCFIPREGWLWISQDVKGEESVLMADASRDEAMISEFLEGSGDMHSLTGRMVFKELEGLSTADIKKYHSDLRDTAKKYEFLWNYLGGWTTLMQNFGLSEERAKELDNRYRSGFKGLIAWQNMRKEEVMRLGYVIINPKTGHRAHIYDFDDLCELKESFTEEFWNKYREIPKDRSGKKSPRDQEERDMVKKVRHYFKRKSEAEKFSVNYCIQGTGAQILRFALINMFRECRSRGWLYDKVEFYITPYDEVNIGASKDIVQEASDLLTKCMREAGDLFTSVLHIDVDVNIGDRWIH